MKVALAFPGCHTRGGVERVMYECANYLRRQGHQVVVFANEWESSDYGGIEYQYVPMRKHPFFFRGSSFYQNASKALSESTFDVLNVHGCICPLGGVHWVHSVQRAWLESSQKFRPRFSWARWRQQLNPLHPVLLRLEEKHFRMRRYSKVIALTERVRDDLNRLYDVPLSDVVIIPNGYSSSEFNPERRAERRKRMRSIFGIKPDQIVLLFAAHELERKGYATVLSALQILGSDRLRLLVVGRNNPTSVMRQAARFGVQSQVSACGPTRDVAGYHAASDIFVLPTQYEAFCLAILEALGSGLPVVTTRVPGAEDAMRHGENGFTIGDPASGEELAQALSLLLDDNCRAMCSKEAAESVREYEWKIVLQRYEEVLRSTTN